jgi:hypothetical protein
MRWGCTVPRPTELPAVVTGWFRRREQGEAPFLIVLVIELLAIGYAAGVPEHWLRAVGGVVLGLVVAGLFRAWLPDAQAGLLRVRRKSFDVACYWGFALLTVMFALALPQR